MQTEGRSALFVRSGTPPSLEDYEGYEGFAPVKWDRLPCPNGWEYTDVQETGKKTVTMAASGEAAGEYVSTTYRFLHCGSCFREFSIKIIEDVPQTHRGKRLAFQETP